MERTPPAIELAMDQTVENEADDDPLQQEVKSSRRNLPSGTEDGRGDDVTSPAAGIAPSDKVLDHRNTESDKPEPVRPRVTECMSAPGTASCCVSRREYSRRARTEDSLRSNGTPNDTGIVECSRVGAGQPLGLVGRADLLDVAS